MNLSHEDFDSLYCAKNIKNMHILTLKSIKR